MMHSGLRKHGRSVFLIALVTSMMLYVVSRDNSETDLRASESLTLTLTKQEVEEILQKEDGQKDAKDDAQKDAKEVDQEDAQEEFEVPNIMPKVKKKRKHKMKKDNFESLAKRKKKNMKNRERQKEIPEDVAISYKMSEPIQTEPRPQTNSNITELLNQERTKLLSKFEGSKFVVLNNKIFPKNDLNSTAFKEALELSVQKKAEGSPVQTRVKESPNHTKSGWPPVLDNSGASLLRQIDLSTYPAEDRSYLESRIEVYEERARHAGAACASFPDEQRNKPRSLHLVWDTKHEPNIVFCPNYKVASTTMMTYFLRLAHFNDDNPRIAKLPPEKQDQAKFSIRFGARQYKVFELYKPPATPQEKLSVFKQALRVIVVRHPFTRILSAYRDKMIKMEPKPAEFKFRELQLKIIAKYREPNSNINSPHPTFAEFVQYVIDSTADLKTSRDWMTNVNCWTPFWSQCEVCSADYNFIIKLETMEEDERFLITVADLKELREIKDWKHKKEVTSTEAAPEFYKQITQEQMQTLYQRYKLDFEIFDYHIDNYLAIAKKVT